MDRDPKRAKREHGADVVAAAMSRLEEVQPHLDLTVILCLLSHKPNLPILMIELIFH